MSAHEPNLSSQIFFPYATERELEAQRLVHYSSADAAMKIIRNREVWLRKSACMNDFMEMEHGRRCLTYAYNHEKVGRRFKSVLENTFPGIWAEIEALFEKWMPDFHHHTYLACLSRHLGGAEDHLGRLSMWRAYGGGVAGVAIVLNGSSFSRPLAALKATASPVAYLSEHGFLAEFDRVTQALETHRDYLIGLGRERVKDYIFAVFRFAVLCTKHPGFKEELEWRVVYQPSLDPSDHIVRCTETINGVPQPIYKMRLQDVPEAGLVGIEIKDLIERVIVGPTRYPDTVCEAFVDALEAAGVPDAKQKVVPSTIPLRQ